MSCHEEGTTCRNDRSMHMTPIRNYSTIWKQSVLTYGPGEQRKRRQDLAVFNVLRGMLESSEYDAMLTHWHNGELEICIKDKCIITCYTCDSEDDITLRDRHVCGSAVAIIKILSATRYGPKIDDLVSERKH
jgi:hypothetical protein